MNIHHDAAESGEGFRYPAPSRATRNWGTRSPFAMRTTTTFNGRVIDCESGLEGKTANALAGRSDVVDIWEQPPLLYYKDDDGKRKRYTVDFLVTMKDGIRYAILVKPKGKLESSGLERIRDLLASQTPRSFADRWVIVTEEKLPRHVVSNSLLFSDVRADGPFSDNPDVAAVLAVVTRPMTVEEAVKQSGLAGRAYRALVRCAIDGSIRQVENVLFDYPAMITPNANSMDTSV